tara:strand:+ start:40945 stop:41136 length:192 start_codon:yes stop_codon:yes gene_type:complete
MHSKGSDNSISERGLINFYKRLISSGRLNDSGAASKRLKMLETNYKHKFNKYYKYKKWEEYDG